MDLRLLRHFVAVAEELHFTRAAVRVGIEQSPLSRSIRTLEQRLDVKLFERTRRMTNLTSAGERLLTHARALLAAADEALVNAQIEDGARHLRIGVCDGVPLPRLSRLLSMFRREYPSVKVQVHEVSMMRKLHHLRDGFLHAALAPESGYGRDIVAEAIWCDSPVLVIPSNHTLARKERISFLEVTHEPLILCRPDTGLGHQCQIEQIVRTVTPTPNIVDRAPTLCMLVMLVLAGYGVGIATAAQLEAIDPKGLAVRAFWDAPTNVSTWLITPGEPVSEPLSCFVDLARGIT